MLVNAFIERTATPTEAELAEALGRPAKALWDKLVAELAEEHGATARDWRSHSRKAGWALRLKRRDRVIVYLSPSRGCFVASFALGEKAAEGRAGKRRRAGHRENHRRSQAVRRRAGGAD